MLAVEQIKGIDASGSLLIGRNAARMPALKTAAAKKALAAIT